MKKCSNCKYRYFTSWDLMDACLGYELTETEEDEIREAECCGKYEEGTPECLDEEYCPSSTNGDYSPSSPWNAPGMSVRDFI